MECPALTVVGSNTTAFAGNPFDMALVSCSPGFFSEDEMTTFTTSCDGTGHGTADWSNKLTCDGM